MISTQSQDCKVQMCAMPLQIQLLELANRYRYDIVDTYTEYKHLKVKCPKSYNCWHLPHRNDIIYIDIKSGLWHYCPSLIWNFRYVFPICAIRPSLVKLGPVITQTQYGIRFTNFKSEGDAKSIAHASHRVISGCWVEQLKMELCKSTYMYTPSFQVMVQSLHSSRMYWLWFVSMV